MPRNPNRRVFLTYWRLYKDISLHEELLGGLFKNSQLCKTAKKCPVGELGLWGNYYCCCIILFPFQDTLVELCCPWFPKWNCWLPPHGHPGNFAVFWKNSSLSVCHPTPLPQFSGSPATCGRSWLLRGGATFYDAMDFLWYLRIWWGAQTASMRFLKNWFESTLQVMHRGHYCGRCVVFLKFKYPHCLNFLILINFPITWVFGPVCLLDCQVLLFRIYYFCRCWNSLQNIPCS